MIPACHPDSELIETYAAGAGGQAQTLVVAAHVALCARCRADAFLLESLGGAQLEDELPVTMAPAALETALAHLDASPSRSVVRSDSAVPFPLRGYVGTDFERIGWRHITPSLSYRILVRDGASKAYITRSAPGAGIGLHSHRGNELTLVLSGGFSDELGHYGRGDLVATDPSVRHTPIADDDGYCITLAATDAPLTFPNFAAGLVARLFGF